MDRQRILVVDDDTEIRTMLRRTLLADGYDVDTARTGREGIDLSAKRRPDLVVMDIGLPDVDGVTAVERIREAGQWVPVLMLTAHGELERRLDSFRAGADDFLSKPFNHEELLVRLQALLRRSAASGDGDEDVRLRRGDIILDTAARTCWRGSRRVTLSPREFDLLHMFMTNPGVVLSRTWLEEQVWGGDIGEGSNAVDVYVGYLRRKLEQGGEARVIQTVRGHGFVLGSASRT